MLAAELMVARLQSIGGITSKKMFGGNGIFHNGKMFCIIDSKGKSYFKLNDVKKIAFEKLGATKHNRMPYYAIPDEILNDLAKLTYWAKSSIKDLAR